MKCSVTLKNLGDIAILLLFFLNRLPFCRGRLLAKIAFLRNDDFQKGAPL